MVSCSLRARVELYDAAIAVAGAQCDNAVGVCCVFVCKMVLMRNTILSTKYVEW